MPLVSKSIDIDIENQIVIKKSDPQLMSIEHEKYFKAHELGLKSNLFKVPKIYNYDKINGVMKLEYISELTRFDSIDDPSDQLIFKIANSLSYIHENLKLKNKITSEAINNIGYKYKSFIHGDFNGQNVCVNKLNGKIVILDWQTAKSYGGKSTYESRLFDVMWFATYSLRIPRKKDLNFFRTIRLSKFFIISYLKAHNEKIDKIYFLNYAINFILSQLRNKKNKLGYSIKKNISFIYSIFLCLIFIIQLRKIFKKDTNIR